MVNIEVLKNDLYLLAKNYYKVIEVNPNEDTYFEVKVDEDRKSDNFSRWVIDFVAEGGVHPDDAERFKNFLDLDSIHEGRLFYRRKINGSWRYVCMEVIPMDNFCVEDPIVLIVVKEIMDYVKGFYEQIL